MAGGSRDTWRERRAGRSAKAERPTRATRGTETAQSESKDLYEKLEQIILPMYYRKPRAYAAVMRYAVSLNASFFNTQRMVLQYIDHAYFPEPGPRLLP